MKILSCKPILLIASILLLYSITSINASTEEVTLNWKANNEFPINIASHQGFANEKHIYIFGGGSYWHTDYVWRGNIDEKGFVDNWDIISNMPSTLTWHTIIQTQSKIFAIGGASEPPVYSLSSVYAADYINNNIENWKNLETANTPESLALGGGVYYNNKVYIFGGARYISGGSPNYSKGSYIGDLNSEGEITGWTQTEEMPIALSSFASTIVNNKILLIGGTSYTGITNVVVIGTISNDGKVTWEQHQPFPVKLSRPGIAYYKNKIFVLGGFGENKYLDTIYYSEINSEGYPTEWKLSKDRLPKQNCCYPAINNDSYLYLIGGHKDGYYLNDVYHTSFETSGSILTVPLFKQNDPEWGAEIYDFADSWEPVRNTIGHLGCAMTSSAMILGYYGHTDVNPSNLNTWLINNNGYLRNGSIIWAGVSAYSNRTDATGSQVEHSRPASYTNDRLDELLAEEVPPIVRLPDPQHFVVVTGINGGDDYTVNDPGGEDAETLSEAEADHGDYTRIEVFRETQSDLSYLVFAVNENVEMKVFDPEVEAITGYTGLDHPLSDNLTGEPYTENVTLNLFSYPKPASGNYKIEITPKNDVDKYQLDLYFFNQEGKSIKKTINGKFENSMPVGYTLMFNKTDIESIFLFRDLRFINVATKVLNYYNSGKITNTGLFRSLMNHLEKADESFAKDNYFLTNLFLELSKNRILIAKSSQIDPDTANDLLYNIESLTLLLQQNN